jgi:DNA-binding phage protein
MVIKSELIDASEFFTSPESQAKLPADALETGDATCIELVLDVISKATTVEASSR